MFHNVLRNLKWIKCTTHHYLNDTGSRCGKILTTLGHAVIITLWKGTKQSTSYFPITAFLLVIYSHFCILTVWIYVDPCKSQIFKSEKRNGLWLLKYYLSGNSAWSLVVLSAVGGSQWEEMHTEPQICYLDCITLEDKFRGCYWWMSAQSPFSIKRNFG